MVESAGAGGKPMLRRLEVLVIILCLGVIGLIGWGELFHALDTGARRPCASNLRQIGIACSAWASGHRQNWPCVYSKESERWDQVGNTRAEDGTDLGPEIPVNSNTANLWALAKAGLVHNIGVFICPESDIEYTVDDVTDPTNSPVRDFRSERGCSYSLQNVLPGPSGYTLTSAASPAMAVAADANPMRRDFWSGAPGGGKKGVTDKKLAGKPDFDVPGWGAVGGPWDLNSPNHGFRGQYVLYHDGHVEWQNNPYCGQSYDNIWTAQVGNLAGREAARPTAPPDFSDVRTLQAYVDIQSYDGTSTLRAGVRTDSFLVP